MKLVRFRYQKKIFWGINENGLVTFIKGTPYKGIKALRKTVTLNRVKLLAPATPSKIILVGLNYKDHARELEMLVPKEPIIFLKPPTALIAHNDKIRYPKQAKRVDYEAELAVIIKKTAKNISAREVGKYILGYSCLNDVTARDLQKRDGQWSRAKSFDTFCPLGPCCETNLDTRRLSIQAYLNRHIRQSSSKGWLIAKVL